MDLGTGAFALISMVYGQAKDVKHQPGELCQTMESTEIHPYARNTSPQRLQ